MDSKVNKKCEICGKQYKILSLNIIDIETADCDCELTKYNEDARREKVLELLSNSGIPKKFMNDRLEDWVNVGDNLQMKEVSNRYMRNVIANFEQGKGILFAGSVGSGKTRMQCALLKRIISFLAVDGFFVSYDEFSDNLAFDSKSENIKPFIAKLKSVDVLMFDDFGECEIVKNNRNYLTTLINHRYYEGKVTLFTTMKNTVELSNIVGDHIVSRVMEMCDTNIVELLNVPDMRKPSNKEKYLNKKGGE